MPKINQVSTAGVRFVSGASTAIAVFLADIANAEARPVALSSWRQFEERALIAGAVQDEERATPEFEVSQALWMSVYGWFQNGGGKCYLAPVSGRKGLGNALGKLEAIGEITIVVAPDLWSGASEQEAHASAGLIADHCARMDNRVAILHLPKDTGASPNTDAGLGIKPDARRQVTVYHPWVEVLDHSDPKGPRLTAPPTGHVAGVWARVDAERGVHKAPANETLRGVVGLSHEISDTEQAELNNLGVNAIRTFPGSGILVWGARTLAASDATDVEHTYINVRRSVNFIKQSIRQSTNWVAFEQNDDRLQTSVKAMITSFLTDLWRRGMLVGKATEEAFYVICDGTNNPPEEVQRGTLTAEVGAALVRPAEFITFEITQQANQGD
ncbi:phage tail sheath family protein [Streptomyces sp. NPDC015171]|uniref:phage tail sheath family protein n=1 Tax=Streptomyces sp. NPDC015171 TaxID=3364945 RepID=UPI0036F5BF7A